MYSKNNYRYWFKFISLTLVCLFLFNELGWAELSKPLTTLQTTTLAAESRLKPFFERHGLNFQNIATVAYTAGRLRDLVIAGTLRESHIVRLNKLFPKGDVQIEKDIKVGSFKCTGKVYQYAVFHFKKENITIKALFFKDHDKRTPDEIKELRITEEEMHHLDCPALEGVWFIDQPKGRQVSGSDLDKVEQKNRDRSEPSFANINLLGPCNLRCRFCIGNDLKAEFDQYNQLKQHFKDWKNLPAYLDQIRARGIPIICVSGQNTDPLMYPYLGEFVDYLHEQGFRVSLRTNGILAKEKMDIINRFDSVSYSVLSLQPETLYQIAGRRKIVDWRYIFENTERRFRVAIVVTRENISEIPQMLRFLGGFPEIGYVQIRKIMTDTRYGLLKEDMDAFEQLHREVKTRYPKVGEYEGAPTYMIEGKQATFWNLAQTTTNSWNYWTNGVYSDSYFDIEGYLENRYKLFISDRHEICRRGVVKDGPERFAVPDEYVSWYKEWPDYDPKYFVHPEVLAQDRTKVSGGWADPEDLDQCKLQESTYEGQMKLDSKGYPLNPKGRTGMKGRGVLGKWGVNYAIDPVITRWNEDRGQYEMLSVKREKSDLWGIPGVIRLDGETGFDALRRKLSEKIGTDFSMEGAIRLYQGYVDDPRNTDNAWMETEVWHMNMPFEATAILEERMGGSDSSWSEWRPLTEENIQAMYANHGEFARLALTRLQPDSPQDGKKPAELMEEFRHMISTGKPLLPVFDVHGTLLEPTWREEYRIIYKKLFGHEMSEEWMERYIAPNTKEEIIKILSRESHTPLEEVREVVSSIREKRRTGEIARALPGALDFVKSLHDAGMPIVISSGSNRDIVCRQLETAGFMSYLSEESIITAPGGEVFEEGDTRAAIEEIAGKYPGYTMVLFDDWDHRIKDIKEFGGVACNLPQGKGKEFAVNRQALLTAGSDYILKGWENHHKLAQVMIEVNVKAVAAAQNSLSLSNADNTNDYRRLISTGKPLVAVLGVHGALLEPTWKEEDRRIYERLCGREMPEGWLEEYIMPYPRSETMNIFSRKSNTPVNIVEEVARDIRTEMRAGHIATSLPGALEFIKMLVDANVPIAIISGAERNIVCSQLETAGFMSYLSEDNIVTAPEGEVYREGKTAMAIEAIAHKYPDHTMIAFDDRVNRVKEFRKYDGVLFGFAHGEGEERRINRERLLNAGFDHALNGWEKRKELAQAIDEINREATIAAQDSLSALQASLLDGLKIGLNGATGSIGAPFARWLLRKGVSRLSILSRSPDG